MPAFTLITQNVDGLHEQAGSRQIVELHGSIQRVRCSKDGCQMTQTIQATDKDGDPYPTCPECGSLLRPDVVWFGEMLPQQALQNAIQASRGCQIFFSIGTSGVVEPAASLPYEALRTTALVVEINPQSTPLSVYAKYYFPQPAGIVLPEIVRAVWGEE